ncbi:MAG TPA: histidinol-phosphate transaminase [Candidatus Latescibacteria bacterium]|nr:histidinol-phosphate transaminase [Candidatus Latescibacterota bacterium]
MPMACSSPDYFLPHIARMEGYVPGEQPRQRQLVKLNTNENPYPPSPLVLERLRAACGQQLRRYPDSQSVGVRSRLADLFQIPPEQILVGNGSDELLNVALRCFAGAGDRVVVPDPTYPYYEKLIQLQDAVQVRVAFPEDFSMPPDLPVAGARVTVIANPNSPSGTLLATESLARLAAETEGVLIIDEAYVDFAAGGAVHLAKDSANVVVCRTMSKSFSLAGMRIGFCFGPPALIAGMGKVKEHYNLSMLSQVAAEAALDDIATMRANADRIRGTRTDLTAGLGKLGFHVWESAANFVLARIASPPASALYRGLKERGVLVRYFDRSRLADCLRITVGTDEEIAVLLRELTELLS